MLRVSGVRIRKAEASDLPQVRECLAIAFEQHRADYTPAMFENTVPTLEGLHHRAAESELRSLGCTTVRSIPRHRSIAR